MLRVLGRRLLQHATARGGPGGPGGLHPGAGAALAAGGPAHPRGLSTEPNGHHKAHTGVVGLDFDPEAHANLSLLLRRVLREVKVIPEGAMYRQVVEATANHRLQVLEAEADPQKVEAAIGEGQLEELIEQAKDELELIPRMVEWKPWEAPEGHRVQMSVEEPVPKLEPEGK